MSARFGQINDLRGRLERIAAGEEDITPPPPPPPEPIELGGDLDDELEPGHIIRPERFTFAGASGTVVSGFTIATKTKAAGGTGSRWLTSIVKGDRRERIILPATIDVDGMTYFIEPTLEPPGDGFTGTWSRASRNRWFKTGADDIPGDKLFNAIVTEVDRFIDFGHEDQLAACRLIALFAILTYNAPVFPTYPYLAINGPAGSGKSKLLDVLRHLSHRPLSLTSTSAAALFRGVHVLGSTVILDEAESIHGAEIGPAAEVRSVFLAGNKRGATVLRCTGDDHDATSFHVAGPKVLGSIREPDPTMASRCIQIFMLRARSGSKKGMLSTDASQFTKTWSRLRDGIFTWSINRGSILTGLGDGDNLAPSSLFPRSREIWSPLLLIAQVLEREGVAGLVAQMQAMSVRKGEAAESALISDDDIAVLRATASTWANHHLDPERYRVPQAKEIASAASASGLGSGEISARRVGAIVRRYGLTPRRVGGISQIEATVKWISAISARYQIELLDPEVAEAIGATPDIPPGHPPDNVTNVTNVTITPDFPEGNTGFREDVNITNVTTGQNAPGSTSAAPDRTLSGEMVTLVPPEKCDFPEGNHMDGDVGDVGDIAPGVSGGTSGEGARGDAWDPPAGEAFRLEAEAPEPPAKRRPKTPATPEEPTSRPGRVTL